jgi:hypothetical protein
MSPAIAQHDRDLAEHLRRAATMAPCRTSEGARRTGKDRHHFCRISACSAAELGGVPASAGFMRGKRRMPVAEHGEKRRWVADQEFDGEIGDGRLLGERLTVRRQITASGRLAVRPRRTRVSDAGQTRGAQERPGLGIAARAQATRQDHHYVRFALAGSPARSLFEMGDARETGVRRIGTRARAPGTTSGGVWMVLVAKQARGAGEDRLICRE